jgi:tetratricopeptide (TPR) repeat protein
MFSMRTRGTRATLWVIVWIGLSAVAPRVLAKPEADPSGAEADARAQASDGEPTGSSDPAARAAFEAGRLAYNHGRFADALSQFELAFELSHHPKLLFNVARAAESDGRHERALAAYAAYLRALPDADNRDFVEARMQRLRAADGGSETLVAPAVPSARETAALDQAARGGAATSATPPDNGATARPFYKRAWFWTVVVVAVAGAVTAPLLVARNKSGPDSYDLSVHTLRVRE